MKIVKFVRDLVVEEVPCGDRQHMLQYWDHNLHPVSYTDLMISPSMVVQHRVVPIHEFFRSTKVAPDTPAEVEEIYIAVSESVDELLGKPLAALKEGNETLGYEISKLNFTLSVKKEEIQKLEDKINKLECDIDRGIDFAISQIMKEWDKVYRMENAPWWRRLFKTWK